MKKNEIMSNLSRGVHKVGFNLKKHSPEILIVAGVVGTVASTVLACRATTKVSEIMNQTKEDVEAVHKCSEDETLSEKYSEDDAKKDLTIIYAQTGVKLAKLYAPAVALGALSITSIVASNQILRKRNVALAAAYATIDKSYKEYRSRVVEKYGEDADRELRYGIKAKKIEETVTDVKTGKDKKVEKTVEVVDPNAPSDYAKFFDENSAYWENDSDYNLMTLRAQQNLANDKLKAQGYLFLNDVYDLLDIPKTKEGQVVGWRYCPTDANIDSYIEFRACQTNREVDGEYVPAILLDFNVDGTIWDKCW